MNKSGVFILSLVLFLAGSWQAVNLGWFSQQNQYGDLFERKIKFNALVVSDPEKAGQYQQRFEVLPERFKQKILVTTFSKNSFFYGDKVFIYGKIKKPASAGDFDYAGYLVAKNIYAQIYNPQIYILNKTKANPLLYYGLRIKHLFFKRLKQYLPEEQGNLLIALLVGEKGLLSESTIAAFNNTGLGHLIAVSSYILSVLLIFLSRLKRFLNIFWTSLACALVTTLYLIIADFSSGVWRAAIMFLFLYLGKLIGRQYDSATTLLFTAALLVFKNPLIIKYDIGFIYSFVSIMGIIYFAPLLQNYFSFIPETFGIKEIFCATASAQIATLPVTIYYFKQLPAVAPLSNLIIIPMVTPTILAGYFLIVPWIGKIIAAVLIAPLNFILLAVYALSDFKYSNFYLEISSGAVLLIYLAEAGLYFFLKSRDDT